MRSDRRSLIWVGLLMAIEVPLSTVTPLIARHLFDVALPEKSVELAARLCVLIVAIAFASQAVGTLQGIILARFHARFSFRLRLRLFRHFQSLPLGWFDDKETGYLMARQTDDVDHLDGLLADTFMRAAVDALRAVVFVGLLFALEPILATTALVFVAAIFALNFGFSRPLRSASRDARETWAHTSASIHDALAGHELVRAGAAETRVALDHARSLSATLKARFRRDMLGLASHRVSGIASGIGMGAILLVGTWRIVEGSFTVGGLFAFFLYLGNLFGATFSLAGLNPTLQRALASAERITEILDTRASVRSPRAPAARTVKGGRIEMRDVDFGYVDGIPVLRGVSIDVSPGETVALVGPSGAGKSTLVSLIPRFRDVDAGSVTVDGHDVRSFALPGLRRSIGFVPQEVFLFNRSVRDNLTFCLPKSKCAQADLERAAQTAHAAPFIDALPNGYDTIIGERGVKLSGGEKQRLAIAREILRNPRILILDEATSDLDTPAERMIQSGLDQLRQDRTCLVIAHRLSTVREADRIYVLENGCVIDSGTHDILLGRSQLYKDLYTTRFRYA